MRHLSRSVVQTVIERLAMAVCVFRGDRLIYSNPAAATLRDRLRGHYGIELDILLRNHCQAARESWRGKAAGRGAVAALLTAPNGEPFYVHIIPLRSRLDVAVTVRILGSEMPAIRQRYGLSAREAQVAELVLHGSSNAHIAGTLGISPGTTKKHLTRIFDKVGVNSRSQLQTRLA
jgi:DNA-binding CsgD family transcriptional regulator